MRFKLTRNFFVSMYMLLTLVFFLPSESFSKNYAFVIGGGCDANSGMFKSHMENWYHALKAMGWDEINVYFGTPSLGLQPFCAESQYCNRDGIFKKLQSLIGSTESSDNVFILLSTHGQLCEYLDVNTYHKIMTKDHEVCIDNDETYLKTDELSKVIIDIKNQGEKSPDNVTFINSSCHSGAGIRFFNQSNVCALSSAGVNYTSTAGDFIDVIGFVHAPENSRVQKKFLMPDELEKFDNRAVFGSDIAKSLEIFHESEAVYSSGFGLDALNVDSPSDFAAAFALWMQDKDISDSNVKKWLNTIQQRKSAADIYAYETTHNSDWEAVSVGAVNRMITIIKSNPQSHSALWNYAIHKVAYDMALHKNIDDDLIPGLEASIRKELPKHQKELVEIYFKTIMYTLASDLDEPQTTILSYKSRAVKDSSTYKELPFREKFMLYLTQPQLDALQNLRTDLQTQRTQRDQVESTYEQDSAENNHAKRVSEILHARNMLLAIAYRYQTEVAKNACAVFNLNVKN